MPVGGGPAMGERMQERKEEMKDVRKEAREALLAARSQRAQDQEERDTEVENTDTTQSNETESESHNQETSTQSEAQGETSNTSEQSSTEADGTQQSDEGDPLLARIELMEKELELRDVQNQRITQEMESWKSRANTRQGEIEHLKSRGTARTETQSDGNQSENDLLSELLSETDDNGGGRSETPQENDRLTGLESELTLQAKEDTLRKFFQDNPDVLVTEGEGDDAQQSIDPVFARYMADHASEFASELGSGSPKKVRKAALNLLKEARLHTKEQRLVSEIEQARAARANVTEEARRRKLAHNASDSSTSTTATPSKGKTKSLEDMSADEIAAVLRKDKNRRLVR